MSKEKINGSFIQHIKRENEKELIVSLKNGDKLRVYAVPTEYGYSAEIKIKKLGG